MGLPEKPWNAPCKPWSECKAVPLDDFMAILEMIQSRGYGEPFASQQIGVPAGAAWLRGYDWTHEGDDPTRGWGHPEMPGVRVEMAVAVAAQREVNCMGAGGQ